MFDIKPISPDVLPKANYNPVAYIDMQPNYFVSRMGVNFIREFDDLAEFEACYFLASKDNTKVYFVLFRYCNHEEGVNVLLDATLNNSQQIASEIISSLNVRSELVSWA